MNQWQTDFTKAVAALEIAYDTDVRAYATLRDDSKAFWGLQPMPLWPEAARTGPMARARAALLAAETTVRGLIARRSIALRQARERRATLHDHASFAPTMPMTFESPRGVPTTVFSFDSERLQSVGRH